MRMNFAAAADPSNCLSLSVVEQYSVASATLALNV